MFAKRQSALAAAAGQPRAGSPRPGFGPLIRFLKRPVVAVGAAGLLTLGAAALFLVVLGDPRAGAPSARVSLTREAPPPAEAPSAYEVFAADVFGLYQDPSALPEGMTADAALITLPDGTRAAGGAGVTAPVLPARPLTPAPIAGLSRPGPDGPLPVIAADGRTPAIAYARPFQPDGRPRVALIVGGLGLNAATTRAAIERLPAEVTLSFVPHAEGLQGWIDLARAQGHEVLIEVPLEPTGYPDNDPGPYTLLANEGPEALEAKLNWILSRAQGYFGLTNYLGDRFATSDVAASDLMAALRERGLAFIDDGTLARRPGAFARATATTVIDETQTPAAIIGRLNALEAAAKTRGQALGAGFSYPVTVEAAARWTAGLDARGVQLAPASAITRRPGR
jgi:polysaccharide deacetylase 2 family uncharacterized protein YibQ